MGIALDHMQNDFDDLSPFYDMCFFDFIIENNDRHLNNWGFSVNNIEQKIIGFAPLWDNGAALDYERGKEIRAGLTFASFNIRYDFLKTCRFRRELAAKARRLIGVIGDGRLERECLEAVQGFERYEARVKPSLAFVEQNCRGYVGK